MGLFALDWLVLGWFGLGAGRARARPAPREQQFLLWLGWVRLGWLMFCVGCVGLGRVVLCLVWSWLGLVGVVFV